MRSSHFAYGYVVDGCTGRHAVRNMAQGKTMLRLLIARGAAAVLAAVALTAAGCLGSMCGDTELYKLTSPGRAHA